MNSTLQVLTIVTAILVLSSGTQVQKCDKNNAPSTPLPTVQLGNCMEGRCVLEKGETYDFMVKFKAPQDDDNVKATAKGLAYGFEMTLESGVDEKACKSIKKREKNSEQGKACPLKKDTHYIYEKQIKIDNNELRIKADVQWSLYSGNDALYCFQLPIQIKDKPKKKKQ